MFKEYFKGCIKQISRESQGLQSLSMMCVFQEWFMGVSITFLECFKSGSLNVKCFEKFIVEKESLLIPC